MRLGNITSRFCNGKVKKGGLTRYGKSRKTRSRSRGKESAWPDGDRVQKGFEVVPDTLPDSLSLVSLRLVTRYSTSYQSRPKIMAAQCPHVKLKAVPLFAPL